MSIVSIEKAIDILNQDLVVALPTETVYGLAGRIESENAIRRIFSTKERPLFDPLIVHVTDSSMAKELTVDWNEAAQKLTDAFWPGPLTILVKKTDKVLDIITAGRDTVAIRCPVGRAFRQAIQSCGPLAAPSANLFKRTSPTTAEHIVDELPGVPVVEGGSCAQGIESTIIDVSETPRILRPGPICKSEIEAILGQSVEVHDGHEMVAPGMMDEHYRPGYPVSVVIEGQSRPTGTVSWLDPDAKIAARTLYQQLRSKQKQHDGLSLVIPRERNGDWTAVIDRLSKITSTLPSGL